MATTELAFLVRQMRDAQKEYFKTRCNAALEKSKRLEKQVDRAIGEIMSGQKSLFGKGGA